MSDAHGLAEQRLYLLPGDQNSPPLRSPSYPYRVTRVTLHGSYLNTLLIFIPIGIVAGVIGLPPVAVFFLNSLAIIPLAPVIAFSIQELSARLGQALGGLLKATLGSNVVEIIIGTIAVSKGQIHIAQASLVGTILSDSLLVLGSNFFFAGYGKERILRFDKTLTSIMSSLMMVASVSLIVPTAMSATFVPSDSSRPLGHEEFLMLSYSTSVVLFVIFIMLLYFRLKTHADDFLEAPNHESDTNEEGRNVDVAEEERRPTLSAWAAGCVLITATLCAIGCAYYVVDSIDGLIETTDVNKTFTGIILIPTITNAAEWITIVVTSVLPITTAATRRKNRIDLAVRVTTGSVLQIVLLVSPWLVLLGWILKQPMTLNFNIFEASICFLAVLVVCSLIQDGRTNYFEGLMLVGTYVIIAAASYVRPEVES